MSKNKFLTVHLHLYQPPREDPWSGIIENQPSAAPFRNWNERIDDECYNRLATARILREGGKVAKLINLYGASGISFNIGATLMSWMRDHAPRTLAAVVEGDRLSRERNGGHGNAMAQIYNHVIMPLASERDKQLQVHWGKAAFRHYYGRDPEGMWLAETAVDTASLEVLAEHGIKYTVLAPRQAKRWRPLDGSADWAEGGVDPTRPYLCKLPSGKSIALFFYDGPISQAVAFERLLDSGDKFRQRILSGYDSNRAHAQHFTIGTDGESYGHHHRHGEMCLAWVIDQMQADESVQCTNYAHFLAQHPPVWEVEIHEASSWSCAHGVERWRSNCGCSFGEGQQEWRRPLREGLNELRSTLAQLWDRVAGEIFVEPQKALEDYIAVLLAPGSQKAQDDFLLSNLRLPESMEAVRSRALTLLEMVHYGNLMFTSCAWFFDHVNGIEAVQNLRYAAKAIQLADEVEDGLGDKLEAALLRHLEQAPCNSVAQGGPVSGYGANGADIWADQVRRLAVSRRIEAMLSGRLSTVESLRKLTGLIREARKSGRTMLDRDRAQEQLLAAYWLESRIAMDASLVEAYQEAARSLDMEPALLGWNDAALETGRTVRLSRKPSTPRAVTADARSRPHDLWRR